MEQVRSEGVEISRKEIRSLVRADVAPTTTFLPGWISLCRERVEVSFHIVEQLAKTMLMLARVLEAEEKVCAGF